VTGNVKVSYVAHLMGAISGLLIGIIVLKNRRVEHWETKLKVVCVVVFGLLIAGMIVWNVIGDQLTHMALGGNVTYFRDDVFDYENDYGDIDIVRRTIQPKCHNYI
jgi:hypothetical protein